MDQGNEEGEEAQDVENQNEALQVWHQSNQDSVDEQANSKDCVKEERPMPPFVVVGRIIQS